MSDVPLRPSSARTIAARCVSKPFQDAIWQLRFDSERVTVTLVQPDGKEVAAFTPEQAAQGFKFPSFSQSITYLSIPVGAGRLEFDLSKDELREVRSFTELAVLVAGPEGIAKVRRAGYRHLAIGIGATALGTIVTAASYTAASSNPRGGSYAIMWGLVVYGLIEIGRGIYEFSRAGRLAKELADLS